MNMEFAFEKLKVWQQAKDLSVYIYRLSNSWPKTESFGLKSQITRAAVSVSANIAEGCSRYSNKDKKRFFEIAYGSNMEVLNHIIIAESIGFCTTTESEAVRTKTLEISKMISGYVRSLNSKSSTPLNPKPSPLNSQL